MWSREVKGCATAKLWLDGRAGGPETWVSWTESRTLLITPGCDLRTAQSKWPAGMETSGRCVAHQAWPLLYFSHPELFVIAVAAACKGKCAEGRCWQGASRTVLNSFLAIFLPSLTTISYFSPPASTCPDGLLCNGTAVGTHFLPS